MKKICCLLLAALTGLLLAACGEAETNLLEGAFTVASTGDRAGCEAAAAFDGDPSTGWVSSRKASETSLVSLEIDLGRNRTVTGVTIDDQFPAGYTNPIPEHVERKMMVSRSGQSSMDISGPISRTPNRAFDLLADGKGWKSADNRIPSELAPQYFWVQFREPIALTMLRLDNDFTFTVPEHFEIYATDRALDQDSGAADTTGYDLLYAARDNDETVVTASLDAPVQVRTLLYVVYSQLDGDTPVCASLDELYLLERGDGQPGKHYPAKFTLLYSLNGEEYETAAEVVSNTAETAEVTFAAPVRVRFLKYLVFSEYGNNFPSVGEFIIRYGD